MYSKFILLFMLTWALLQSHFVVHACSSMYSKFNLMFMLAQASFILIYMFVEVYFLHCFGHVLKHIFKTHSSAYACSSIFPTSFFCPCLLKHVLNSFLFLYLLSISLISFFYPYLLKHVFKIESCVSTCLSISLISFFCSCLLFFFSCAMKYDEFK